MPVAPRVRRLPMLPAEQMFWAYVIFLVAFAMAGAILQAIDIRPSSQHYVGAEAERRRAAEGRK